MNRALPLVVALLAVTAGCSGVFSGDSTQTPTGTVTPVPITTETATPTATATPPDVASPPGVSITGEIDVMALYDAHRSVLADRSFTATQRGRLPGEPPGLTRYNQTVTVASDGRIHERAVIGDRRVQLYANTSRTYLRIKHSRADDAHTALKDSDLEDVRERILSVSVFYLGSTESADVSVVERDGRTLFRVFVTEQPDQDLFRRTIRNYTATAYVTPDGLVETTVASFLVRKESGTGWTRAKVRVEYRSIGETTVQRPSWVDRMEANRTVGATTTAAATTGAGNRTTTGGGNETTTGG